MKRFVWRLQKVLDVKTREEQSKRIELFELAEQLAAKRGELLMKQRTLHDMLADIKRDSSPQRLGHQEFFLKHVATDNEKIRQLVKEIAALEMRHKEKAAELLVLRRFKEGLENLRAQARKEFIEAQEKLEQKESDERATIAFARNENRMSKAGRTACVVVPPPSSVLQNQEHNR